MMGWYPAQCLLGCTWHKSLSMCDSPDFFLAMDLSNELHNSELGIASLNIFGCVQIRMLALVELSSWAYPLQFLSPHWNAKLYACPFNFASANGVSRITDGIRTAKKFFVLVILTRRILKDHHLILLIIISLDGRSTWRLDLQFSWARVKSYAVV